MPQLQLPVFQQGVTLITPDLGYALRDGQVIYLHGMTPVFTHALSDIASFKMIVSQFYLNGAAKQAQIVTAFGINPQALKRWVKKYKHEGAKAFFVEKRGRAKGKKNDKDNRILRELCEQLNETETSYPGTKLRIIYKPVSD